MMFVDGWSPTLIRIQTRRPAVIWKIGAYTTSRSLPMGARPVARGDAYCGLHPATASCRTRAGEESPGACPGWPESTCYAIDPTVPDLVSQSGSV